MKDCAGRGSLALVQLDYEVALLEEVQLIVFVIVLNHENSLSVYDIIIVDDDSEIRTSSLKRLNKYTRRIAGT